MNKGYTLVEAVILIAISVVALIALVNLFLIFNTIYGYQRAFIQTAGSAGTSLNALQSSVLPADSVLASHEFSGTTYASATTTLVLQLPSVDATGALISGAKDYVVFFASSTAFYRLVEADAASARTSGLTRLSNTLYALAFTYDAASPALAGGITATVETRLSFKDQLLRSLLTETWHLRNYSAL